MKLFVNLITLFRILGTCLILMFYNRISNLEFIIYLVLLFLSDFVDGKLARKYKVQSLFGSILDTIADKFLSIILIFILINKEPRMILIIYCEILIALINTYGFLKNKDTSSNIFGKIKTWLLFITIGVCYIKLILFNIPQIIISTLIYATFIIQLYVIIKYINNLIKQKNKKYVKMQNIKKHSIKYILFDTNYYMNLTHNKEK